MDGVDKETMVPGANEMLGINESLNPSRKALRQAIQPY
jgi:hypothetical protein